jgi:hypothetical protein
VTARDHLAQLLGPAALDELDADVAAAPPLPDTAASELAAVMAAELAPEPQVA